jgi:hypothetical protein
VGGSRALVTISDDLARRVRLEDTENDPDRPAVLDSTLISDNNA